MNREVKLSSSFKLQTTKAVASIILFVVCYVILLILALGLTAICVRAGVVVISIKPSFILLGIGLGIIALALFICFFLIKFLFQSNEMNIDHLVEINESQEPKLFKIIHELADQVGTSPPKKVYVSSAVNASVFYNSSFWSMFLPIKKNLVIGMGLVNTTTETELRAILSHEFGHFSQKTMRVGSYVYYVNHIIFNLVHQDEAYENSVRKLTESLGIIGFFVLIAYHINRGIQLILIQLYFIVNKSYLSLSREMEFHADEVAASITGYEPLKTSLLRMTLADMAYNDVLNYYQARYSDNIISQNLLKEQSLVIQFLSEYNDISITEGLPNLSLEEQSKYDKSKLTIKNQWASHPSLTDRIARLENTGFHCNNEKTNSANEIFINLEFLQKESTKKLFYTVDYAKKTIDISAEQFIEDYKSIALSSSYSKIFNGYYDSKNPIAFELDQVSHNDDTLPVTDLFSDYKVDLVYSALALLKDSDTLKYISENSNSVRTFDYDGIKYNQKDVSKLLQKLKEELQKINEEIKLNDIEIYKTFYALAISKNEIDNFKDTYKSFQEYCKNYEEKSKIYEDLFSSLQFLNKTTPFEEILTSLNNVKSQEQNLKTEINHLLSEPLITEQITVEMRNNFNKYCSQELFYFDGTSYNNQNIELMIFCLNSYLHLVNQLFYIKKKSLLDLQSKLISQP